jgi:hypothetical protein
MRSLRLGGPALTGSLHRRCDVDGVTALRQPPFKTAQLAPSLFAVKET